MAPWRRFDMGEASLIQRRSRKRGPYAGPRKRLTGDCQSRSSRGTISRTFLVNLGVTCGYSVAYLWITLWTDNYDPNAPFFGCKEGSNERVSVSEVLRHIW